MNAPETITSRDNALVKELRRIQNDGAGYRKNGRIWIEGVHLREAFLAQWQHHPCVRLTQIISQDYWDQKEHSAHTGSVHGAIKTIIFSNALMKEVSALESPGGCGLLVEGLVHQSLDAQAPSLVLDRLQDPGNVGSIVRSAAAFGYTQILALKGTVALWSPKVLRAGMGAHFSLRLIEGGALDDVRLLQRPLALTSSHRGDYLHQLSLTTQPNWVFGHEGQGASCDLESLAQLHVRIAQPGGQESLNVAAAAAICLHASVTRISHASV